MERGVADVASLTTQLTADNERDAYVRVLLRRDDDDWHLHHASILVGAEPPNWAQETWQYTDVGLVAHRVPAADLPALVLQAALGKGTLGDLAFSVPATSGQAQWRREPSYARLDHLPFGQPSTVFTVGRAQPDTSAWPSSMLVAESCPSFPEVNSAWRAFTEGDYALSGAQAPPQELAVIRMAEHDAWLGPVHVSAAEMTVEVRGTNVAGSILELYGVSDRVSQRLDAPGTITLPLANGLPDDAWLWLKRGARWLDFRSISPRSGWTGDLARAGVEIEVPVDPQASVEALIAAGEGPQTEFKRELIEYQKLKTVAAFATGAGGTLVFGVDRDEVTVVGLGDGEPNGLRDRLGDFVKAAIRPIPEFDVTPYVIDGKTILLLAVPPGQNTPYGVIPKRGAHDRLEYYVRRGASTIPAQPDDLRQAVMSRAPATSQSRRMAW